MTQNWIAKGNHEWAHSNLQGAVKAYAQSIVSHPLLGLHALFNLHQVRKRYRHRRVELTERTATDSRVAIIGSELSHNAAGRAASLYDLYNYFGYHPAILGYHFPAWGRDLWEPIRQSDMNIFSVIVEEEIHFVGQAFNLVANNPADIVHLSKPRLPSVVTGILYQLVWDAIVIMDIDDEELHFVKASSPISLEELKRECNGYPTSVDLRGRLWTRYSVGCACMFDAVTVANNALQKRYGGTVLPHTRCKETLKPASDEAKISARAALNLPASAKIILFYGTPRRHKGVIELAKIVAALPDNIEPILFVVGSFSEDTLLLDEVKAILPTNRLYLKSTHPIRDSTIILATADLVVLLSHGQIADYQSPAKLSDALGAGLPVIATEVEPLKEAIRLGAVIKAETQSLPSQILQLLTCESLRHSQSVRARAFFEAHLSHESAKDFFGLLKQNSLNKDGLVAGELLSLFEALAPAISSPILADHLRRRAAHSIDWAQLKEKTSDDTLASIIIPVYGDSTLIQNCINSILGAKTEIKWEIIAVVNDLMSDNLSALDEFSRIDSRIRFILPNENLRFAAGSNLGFASTSGSYTVFLNNDCTVNDWWLDYLINELISSPNCKGVQALEINREYGIQSAGVVFHKSSELGYSLFHGLPHLPSSEDQKIKLQAVSGACMAVRRSDFIRLKGFDVKYINGQEDVDYCKRQISDAPGSYFTCATKARVAHIVSATPGRHLHVQWNRIQFSNRWKRNYSADDLTIYQLCNVKAIEWVKTTHTGFNRVFDSYKPILAENVEQGRVLALKISGHPPVDLLRMAYPQHSLINNSSPNYLPLSERKHLTNAINSFALFKELTAPYLAIGNIAYGDSLPRSVCSQMPSRKLDFSRPYGVNLIGHARNTFGIGEDVRMAAMSLANADIPFSVTDLNADNGTSCDSLELNQWILGENQRSSYFFNIFCLAPPSHARWLLKSGVQNSSNQYSIAIWPWETNTWPKKWLSILAFVDEIWAPSKLVFNALEPVINHSKTHLRIQSMAAHIPHAASYRTYASRISTRLKHNIPESSVVFIYSFDPRSTLTRKNPMALLEAYQEAFSPLDNVRLVLKTLPTNRYSQLYQAFMSRVKKHGSIIFIESSMSRGELFSLYGACDCFVSTHRSEGFGRNIAEALQLGLEVITTGYGGNLDFPSNSPRIRLLPYSLVQIRDGEYPFASGHYWAEPNIQATVNAMRDVYALKKDRSALDRLTPADIASSISFEREVMNYFSFETVGGMYRDRLRNIYDT